MSKMILGLDLGSNSLGWGLLKADECGRPLSIVDAGVRIFPKAVEEKTPTPKNQKRRTRRLARRTTQRRARRKKQLLKLLVSLNLLPRTLLSETRPEGILNGLGDPYQLRKKALDQALTAHELGRVLLHLVQRRGFLSNRRTLLGRDMLDDPDVLAVLEADDESDSDDAEENAFKAEISRLRQQIKDAGCRTLGEYLAARGPHECKRNRHSQHLRTDRRMYQEELELIFERQAPHHSILTFENQIEIERIIFHQRPLKLKKDRVGKCSLEPKNKRAAIARLEYQRFRYLQDINNLTYRCPDTDDDRKLSGEHRQKLVALFEASGSVSFAKIRKELGVDKKTEFNLDSGVKKLRGNTTAAAIRSEYPGWDELAPDRQHALVDDLLSIRKKSALQRRLQDHWKMNLTTAVQLCLVELEPGYGSVSLKAIRRLLPHLEKGLIYSDARVKAGYGYETRDRSVDKLGPPPELPNPIVNKALHELRRVTNAIIKAHGKPEYIRIEMARDLEMNTRRYKSFIEQQRKNTKANDEATAAYQGIYPNKYPSRDDKIRYRLWEDQGHRCAYNGNSGENINLATLWSAQVEVDHILPYSQSLDDSYMNKVVCMAGENRRKGQKTPVDAFSGDKEKWHQITQAISRWPQGLKSKRERFYRRGSDLLQRDFIGNQLSDTRYIAREAGAYVKSLGVNVSFSRGVMTAWLRRQWGLNDLIGDSGGKDRSDHRHHTIDAVVTACIDRPLYKTLVEQYKDLERSGSQVTMEELHVAPPVGDIKEQLKEKLEHLIVSHVPQRKITGALHEATGVGFIEGVGTVYRLLLDKDFSIKKAESIIDDTVRELVTAHLAKFNGDAKKAFAEGFQLLHKDGKTPIKRVRVVQSKTTRDKLEKDKFAITDTEGRAFKWHVYGNTHHVEIFRHCVGEDKYHARFVTAVAAAQRVRAKAGEKRPLINTDYGEEWEFLMALHINDLVRVVVNEEEQIHRVQTLEMIGSRITTRLHTAATLSNESEEIRKSINTLMKQHRMELLHVNSIGLFLSDQAHD